MNTWKKLDWKLLIALVALILSIFAGVFWRRADIVFDTRAVEIPLSDPLRKSIENALASGVHIDDSITVTKNGQQISSGVALPLKKLPDKLLYVNIRNVGHVPSNRLKVRLMVPGIIADKQLSDAGPAFGNVEQKLESDSTGELFFECQNLANHQDARIKIALWYQQTRSGNPSIQIQDIALGPAREVGSVEAARFFWWNWSDPTTKLVSAMLGVVFPFLSFIIGYYFGHRAEDGRQDLEVLYDNSQCSWAEGSMMGTAAMQVYVRASLSTSSRKDIEVIQAYLKGGKPQGFLIVPIQVSEKLAVTVPLHFFVQPLLAKAGEPYRGSLVLVDREGKQYEGPQVEIPYRGAVGAAKQ